jgi:3-dehydrosphinganine reductase
MGRPHAPKVNMATNINSWTVIGALLGALVLIPSIMGLFSKNKFNVNGKV